MATAKVLTLVNLAEKLKVSSERARQLREEAMKANRHKIGILVGNTIVLTHDEIEEVAEFYREKVRNYTKSKAEKANAS